MASMAGADGDAADSVKPAGGAAGQSPANPSDGRPAGGAAGQSPANPSDGGPAGGAAGVASAPRAEFFEVVRLLLDAARRDGRAGGIGGETPAADEPMRLRAVAGQVRPDREVAGVRTLAAGPDAPPRTEVLATFMGLTGPLGMLPDHYTERVVEGRREREEGLGDFLALFDHRLLSLFWRAWARSRLPVAFEADGGALRDPFSRALAGLAGLGVGGEAVPDEGLLGMAGALSRPVRSADALRRLLGALFGLPVQVLELQGRWRTLGDDERTRIGGGGEGTYARLGHDALAGAAVFDVANSAAVRLGPLDAGAFEAFFAGDGPRAPMEAAIRRVVGGTADVEIQLVLRAADVPRPRLGGPGARLGQTCWLLHGPSDRDRDEARLRVGLREA